MLCHFRQESPDAPMHFELLKVSECLMKQRSARQKIANKILLSTAKFPSSKLLKNV